VINHL